MAQAEKQSRQHRRRNIIALSAPPYAVRDKADEWDPFVGRVTLKEWLAYLANALEDEADIKAAVQLAVEAGLPLRDRDDMVTAVRLLVADYVKERT